MLKEKEGACQSRKAAVYPLTALREFKKARAAFDKLGLACERNDEYSEARRNLFQKAELLVEAAHRTRLEKRIRLSLSFYKVNSKMVNFLRKFFDYFLIPAIVILTAYVSCVRKETQVGIEGVKIGLLSIAATLGCRFLGWRESKLIEACHKNLEALRDAEAIVRNQEGG